VETQQHTCKPALERCPPSLPRAIKRRTNGWALDEYQEETEEEKGMQRVLLMLMLMDVELLPTNERMKGREGNERSKEGRKEG